VDEVEGDVNTREECLIKFCDVISGHKQDCRVVFEVAARKQATIAFRSKSCKLPLLHEDIRLVNENDRLPYSGEFYFTNKSKIVIDEKCSHQKHVAAPIKSSSFRTQVPSSYHVEWPLHV